MKRKLSNNLSILLGQGFFHIFGANVINKIITFLLNIIIVWFLTKNDYGIFSYAYSLYSIALLFTGFGILSGTFQLCSEKRPEDEKTVIFGYSLRMGIAIDSIIGLLIILLGLIITMPIAEAGSYFAMLGPLLVLDYLFQYASTVLRTKKKNKQYAALQSVNTIAYFIFGCAGAYFGGITGTILGRYLAYLLSLIVVIWMLKSISFTPFKTGALTTNLRKKLWGFSIPTQVSSSLNQLTFLLNVVIVGFFIQDSFSVATYKVATMIPEGLLFIPQSVIIFIAPYFIENNTNMEWFGKRTRTVLGLSVLAYGLISMALVVFAQFIVTLLWGDAYLDAVFPFQILAISFLFSSLRMTCTNLLAALYAVKANLVISIASAVINIAFCVILIPILGITGAAAAPLVVSACAAAISFALLSRKITSLS